MFNGIIPLSSDTESQPTDEMREAIASAVVGDEQQGNDPTVNLLQERVADLLGKEAALWLPGGTMCNFIATKVHTQPADAIIAESMAHIIRAESGGVAISSGILIEPIKTERGIFSADQLREAIDRITTVPVPYGQPCGMIAIEQTHNLSGGSVWSLEELKAVHDVATELEIPLHMDGARLLNACIAHGVSAASIGALVDTVWIDFTKGLGAPIGAVLAGSKEFIAKARRMKHVFGGAMRQAGIAAAGCIYALDNHVDRLADDHENARALAQGLSNIDGIRVLNPQPESNMVFFNVHGMGHDNKSFVEALKKQNIKIGGVGSSIRAVTHLDVTAEDIQQTIETIRTLR